MRLQLIRAPDPNPSHVTTDNWEQTSGSSAHPTAVLGNFVTVHFIVSYQVTNEMPVQKKKSANCSLVLWQS